MTRLQCWLLSASIFATACSPTVQVPIRRPGEADLGVVVTLSRGKFDGKRGEDFADRLTQRFVSSGYFDVLARAPGGEDEEGHAVFRGSVLQANYAEDVKHHEGDCFKLNLKKYKCVMYTREGRSACAAKVQLLSKKTSELLVSQELSNDESLATQGTNEPPPAIDGEALVRKCLDSLADRFARYLAPHEVVEPVALEEDSELPSLKIGNGQLQGGQHERALESYQAAVEQAESQKLDPESLGRAHYNLAVAHAILRNYPASMEHLEVALSLCACRRWIEFSQKVHQWSGDSETFLRQQETTSPPAMGDDASKQ